jgi:hypothetical protein
MSPRGHQEIRPMPVPYRAALYVMPGASDPLGAFGAAWLGRTADGAPLPPRPVEPAGWSAAALDVVTAEPRRYGFHATLRAPFRPADGVDLDMIEARAADLAAALPPVVITQGLQLRRIAHFLALVPAVRSEALQNFAARIVEGTNDLRRPLDADDRAKRLAKSRLTPRQIELMDRWGYPHVLEDFRFHMTLTGRLPEDEPAVGRLFDALAGATAGFAGRPFIIDAIAVAVEFEPGAPFICHRRFALSG